MPECARGGTGSPACDFLDGRAEVDERQGQVGRILPPPLQVAVAPAAQGRDPGILEHRRSVFLPFMEDSRGRADGFVVPAELAQGVGLEGLHVWCVGRRRRGEHGGVVLGVVGQARLYGRPKPLQGQCLDSGTRLAEPLRGTVHDIEHGLDHAEPVDLVVADTPGCCVQFHREADPLGYGLRRHHAMRHSHGGQDHPLPVGRRSRASRRWGREAEAKRQSHRYQTDLKRRRHLCFAQKRPGSIFSLKRLTPPLE